MNGSGWNRYPGGKQITTGCGERIKMWFHRRAYHTFQLGVSFRAVTFADNRSGWSGVAMTVHLGWWSFSRPLLAWRNGPSDRQRVITLAEQIRQEHSRGPSLEEQEDKEAKDKAEDRARMELFDKQLKEYDARHQPNTKGTT